jgi:uncharacterized tellurite resistance protein B-like protein
MCVGQNRITAVCTTNWAYDRRRSEVLARHFGLTGADGQRLLVLAEVMWGLVLADGEIADHEHYLTRKISMLELEPAYLSSAKAAAAARAGKPHG